MKSFTKVFIAAIFLLSVYGCDRKSCTHVVCPSYEGCYQGECICPDGYQGANCDSISANQYTGTWNVSENCGSGVPANATGYQVYIQPTISPIYDLTISNLLNLNNSISNVQIYNTAPGNEGSQIYIPAQNVGGINIQNSYGTYTNANGYAEIIINLNYTYNSINYTCQETLVLQ